MFASVEGHFDGSSIVLDDDISLLDGQKVIITILDNNFSKDLEKDNRNAKYLAKIKKGLEQCRNGRGQIHELIEV